MCFRMIRITKENTIGGPCLKLVKLTHLEYNTGNLKLENGSL
jgi:hypothetical protein